MAGMDPRRPERHLGRRYDDTSVRGFDVTCSAPKSVSVLWAVGDEHGPPRGRWPPTTPRSAAMVGWIEAHAHTRFRIGGEVAVVDAEGIVAAAFRQHTSRAADPQLHTHVVIANRVALPGLAAGWRWTPARSSIDQRTLSALYHAGLRAELTRRLGVRWDVPEHGIAEMADVAEGVLVEFSRRTGDVQRRTDEKLDRFADTMGREPTPRERWRLEREAVLDSRPAKPKALDGDVLHGRWAEQTVALGLDPAAGRGRAAVGHVRPGLGIDRSAAGHRGRPGDGRAGGGAVDVAAGGAGPGAGRRRADHHRRRSRPAGRVGGSDGGGGGGVAMCRPVPPRAGRCAAASGWSAGHRVGDRPGAHHPGDPRPGGRPAGLGRPPHSLHLGHDHPDAAVRSRRAVERRPGRRPPRRSPARRSGAGRRPGRHRQDHRPGPRRRAAPGRRAGGVRGRPLGHRGRGPRRRDRRRPPTPSTSSSSSTASTGHPITATTSPSAPP